MFQSSRVAVIGSGSVGSTIAFALLIQRISAEILMVDIVQEVAEGQVADLSDANFIASNRIRVGTFEEAGQCDIIVVTAGAKQRPGETRLEVFKFTYILLS